MQAVRTSLSVVHFTFIWNEKRSLSLYSNSTTELYLGGQTIGVLFNDHVTFPCNLFTGPKNAFKKVTVKNEICAVNKE